MPRASSASTPIAFILLAFAVGCALAGLGGALLGPLFLIFPQMGDLPLLKGLTAIVLGGMASIPGADHRRLGDRHHRGDSTLFVADRLSRHGGVRDSDRGPADPRRGACSACACGATLDARRAADCPHRCRCRIRGRLYLLPFVVRRLSLRCCSSMTLTLCYAMPAIGAQFAARLHGPGVARPYGVRRRRRLHHRASDEERHRAASAVARGRHARRRPVGAIGRRAMSAAAQSFLHHRDARRSA